jgi:hypothetical protein
VHLYFLPDHLDHLAMVSDVMVTYLRRLSRVRSGNHCARWCLCDLAFASVDDQSECECA